MYTQQDLAVYTSVASKNARENTLINTYDYVFVYFYTILLNSYLLFSFLNIFEYFPIALVATIRMNYENIEIFQELKFNKRNW